MSGPEFFQTVMGKQYYEYHFPELVKQIKRLNDNLEKLIELQSTPQVYSSEPPEQCTTCNAEEFSMTSTGWKCNECGDLA